ncbi:MAG: hypothetical protein LBU31_03975 [Coriobacteriales bacterium]|jgi:hypothetical protein|nr:hypothetical protein [Coriobacteriales bacterium]
MDIHDLTDIVWERNLTGYTSGGAYFKASITDANDANKRYYCKLSNYDDENGFIGFESVYEYLASKLGLYLGFDVLDCEILKARIVHNGREYVTFVQKALDFLPVGMSKLVFEKHYEMEKQDGETRLEFLIRHGFAARAYEMFLFDYLIYNRDRHCNNLEFIKSDSIKLAPLFDNGVSFFAPYAGKRSEIDKFDIMSNNITNNDFGSKYLEDNLMLIDRDDWVLKTLDDNDLWHTLFSVFGDDASFPSWHRDRAFELIIRRYHHAKALLDNR